MPVVPGRAALVVLCGCIALAACGGAGQPAPSSSPPPSIPSDAVQVTGRERFGWTQTADDIGALHFAVYVDNIRVELPQAACHPGPGGVYDCDSPLPALAAGLHVLELVSWITINDQRSESPRAAPLRVFVTSSLTSSAQASAPAAPPVTTAPIPSDLEAAGNCGLAPLSEGDVLMWDDTGAIRKVDRQLLTSRPVEWTSANAAGWTLSSVVSHPLFAKNGWIYVAEVRAQTEPSGVRLTRYRDAGDVLGERMVMLEVAVPARPPRTRLTFGPDGDVYLALLAGPANAGDDTATERRFLIRVNDAGAIPADNPARSVFNGTTARVPLAIAWSPGGPIPWILERARTGSYILRTPAVGSASPRRFTAPSLPIALQIVETAQGQRIVVVDVDSDVMSVNAADAGVAGRAATRLFPTDRIVFDALAFSSGDLLVCGPLSGRSAPYGTWRVRSAF